MPGLPQNMYNKCPKFHFFQIQEKKINSGIVGNMVQNTFCLQYFGQKVTSPILSKDVIKFLIHFILTNMNYICASQKPNFNNELLTRRSVFFIFL